MSRDVTIGLNRAGDVFVHIRLPGLPEGFEYTGEFRLPNQEEYFLDFRRGCCRISMPEESRPQVGDFRFILRKVPKWRPAVPADIRPEGVRCRVREVLGTAWKYATLYGFHELHGIDPGPSYPFVVRLDGGSKGFSYHPLCEVQDNAPEDQPQQSVTATAEEPETKGLLCVIMLPGDGSMPPIHAEPTPEPKWRVATPADMSCPVKGKLNCRVRDNLVQDWKPAYYSGFSYARCNPYQAALTFEDSPTYWRYCEVLDTPAAEPVAA